MKGTPCRPSTYCCCVFWHPEMVEVQGNRSWWELGGHKRGKDRNLTLWQQGIKSKFLGSRVTSKETQENASQELLALNPKVTFKILTHPICITLECHLHNTYWWSSFGHISIQLLNHHLSPPHRCNSKHPKSVTIFSNPCVRENLH